MSRNKNGEEGGKKDPAGWQITGILHDRDQSTTQMISLIAASFRT